MLPGGPSTRKVDISVPLEAVLVEVERAGVLSYGADDGLGEAVVVGGVDLDGDFDVGAKVAGEVGDDLRATLAKSRW